MIEILELKALKEDSPGFKIIYVLFGEHEFAFRTITRKEYRNIVEISTDDYDFQDIVCNASCIIPEGYNFSNSPLAGLPKKISEVIVRESGFANNDDITNMFYESKAKVNAFDTQCTLLVKAAFPEYTIEEIEDWTFERLIDMSVKAEFILSLKGHKIPLFERYQEVNNSIVEEAKIDKYEKAKKLIEQGIDPMNYFRNELAEEPDFVELPTISRSWEDEGELNAIRKQMEKRKASIHRQQK